MGLREMNELRGAVARCRLCDAPVARDADVCASCGVKAPWVSDEPSVSPRVIRLVMWGGGIILAIMLLFVVGMLAFGPVAENEERDHRAPTMGSQAR
jgi:hypothetical protein